MCATNGDHFCFDSRAVDTFGNCFDNARHVVEVDETVSDEEDVEFGARQWLSGGFRFLLAEAGCCEKREEYEQKRAAKVCRADHEGFSVSKDCDASMKSQDAAQAMVTMAAKSSARFHPKCVAM
jgi:hypothetical protein